MKHFGDIKQLNGAELPVVDVITGGSPCQDLSLAGSRKGLDGERSGLFLEQIRIVKEMREHDRNTDDYHRFHPRPRFMVWENVPGTFSSNKGRDFQAVLTEIVRIVKPDAPDVPLPNKGGWSKSGCLMGYGEDGCPFSIAWRLHDAQFWGVPQRRKRIAVVGDFGGLAASEILFVREGLYWNPSESEGAEQTSAARTGSGSTGTDQGSGDEPYGDDLLSRESWETRGGKGILVTHEKVGTLSTCDIHRVLRGGVLPDRASSDGLKGET